MNLPPFFRDIALALGRTVVRAGEQALDSVLADGQAVAEEVDRRVKRARKRLKRDDGQ
jgi:hypothetical protein